MSVSVMLLPYDVPCTPTSQRRAEAVNQWVVRNETNGERGPPALVDAPKRRQPRRRCPVSPLQETPFYGRFARFLGTC